jgi:hypothetical protein
MGLWSRRRRWSPSTPSAKVIATICMPSRRISSGEGRAGPLFSATIRESRLAEGPRRHGGKVGSSHRVLRAGSIAIRHLCPSPFPTVQEQRLGLFVKPARQHAVFPTSGPGTQNRPQIVARPTEAVDLVADDPRPFAIEAKMGLGIGGNLDHHRQVGRRGVGDRQMIRPVAVSL